MIEQFTLKEELFAELAELITKAFLADEAAIEEGASIVFTPETFKIMFGAPSVNRDLFVRIIHKPTKELVGFLGLIPRKLKIVDTIYDFGMPAWLCVHPKHRRKGLARAMGQKLFEIGKKAGIDGGFSLHEPDQHGIDASLSVVKKEGIAFQKLAEIKKFIIRVFDAEKVATVVKLKWYEKLFFKLKEREKPFDNPKIRLYRESDLDRIHQLVEELVAQRQISIIPTYEDIQFMLRNPKLVCVVHEDRNGKIDGFITAWEFLLAGFDKKIPFGWMDIVQTDKLSDKEAIDLANYLSIKAKEQGWVGLQTPYIPYFKAKPFKKANFIFFNKQMTLDVYNFKKIDFPEPIKSIYFDWR